jgi:thiamine biosynthesis lipoprotein
MRAQFTVPPIVLLVALCAGGNSVAPHGRPFVFHYENVLGTSLELKIDAGNSGAADRADAAARREIEREAGILSAWDSSSEFSRWAATLGRPIRVSPDLFEMLSQFDQWRIRTGGTLDASAETVVRVWKNAEREGRRPSRAELAAAVNQVRHPHWRLDPVTHTATHLDRAPIALNSFAKSFIAGRAADAALAVSSVTSVVVNIGGDLVVRGPRSERVDIADPRCEAENCAPLALVQIQGRALATSGNYRRGFEIAGHHYSHIVDPRTGMTAETILSSSVAAPNPADAGAMATAFSVLTPTESQRIAASIPHVDYLIVTTTGERIASAAWSKLAGRRRAAFLPAVAAPPDPAVWDPSLGLTITVELAHPSGNFRRPYLAIWVEDASKAPVRTIALWYNKDRYLPEMRAWYRIAQASPRRDAYGVAHSIASATRWPGKYTFDWDGKDDAGKLVAPGNYTVFIEAAREHGTYQLMHQEMDFRGTPARVDLKGNAEISGASLDYHKLAAR